MKILFVDDEKEILSSIKRQLRKEEFSIQTALSGEEALELLKNEIFSVVISDERMPDISGLDLMKKIKKLYPETIRIILSGYADSQTIIDSINQGEIFRFISKPWSYKDLKKSINKALEKWKINQSNRHFMESIIEENRRLKKRLSYRETKLDLNQDVLDQVPSPIIVVGKDDTIEAFNRKVQSSVKMQIVQGQPITDIITEGEYRKLEINFSKNGGSDRAQIKINGLLFNIFIRGLRPTDDFKGIVILEKINEGVL